MSDILLIGLFTYLSNGEDYEDIVLFAESHYDFVKQYCELPKGIPSHYTFNRIFKHLNPSVLRDLLTDYGKKFWIFYQKNKFVLMARNLEVFPLLPKAIKDSIS
ncbi:MAG: transposase family protein [Flavobacteriaceae bacterium]|nr:transposase family protein [Flavobacteriaceae bacterium]